MTDNVANTSAINRRVVSIDVGSFPSSPYKEKVGGKRLKHSRGRYSSSGVYVLRVHATHQPAPEDNFIILSPNVSQTE